MQSTAFFLFGDDPRNGARVVCGTGALIGLNHPEFDPQQQFTRDAYGVTAAHVVRGGGSVIRLNTKDGKSRYVELDPAEWTFSDTDDLAAIDLTDRLSDQDEVVVIHDTWLADQAILNHYNISVGEDGFMLGLFADIVSEHRNVVTARFGNVSLVGREDVPIKYGNRARSAHLFDMKSRPGFSGSPVFVYRTPSADLRVIDQGAENPSWSFGGQHDRIAQMGQYWRDRENTLIKMLGIHVGQYVDTVRVMQDGDVAHEVSEFIRDGDMLRIPNSMSVVATSDSIKELLSHPALSTQREQRDKVRPVPSHGVLMERTIYSGWSPNRGR